MIEFGWQFFALGIPAIIFGGISKGGLGRGPPLWRGDSGVGGPARCGAWGLFYRCLCWSMRRR